MTLPQYHPPGEFLKVREVASMLGCSPRTVWKLTAAGKFPAPVRLTPRLPRWNKNLIEIHLTALAAQEAKVRTVAD